MKIQNIAKSFAVAMVLVGLSSLSVIAQTNSGDKTYEQMSRAERAVFISAQMKRISRELSGTEYQLTPEFEQDIQKAVSHYASRLERSAKHDLRLTLERGRSHAPTLTAPFRARNLSPLFGLYIPFIESEYKNLESSKPMGSIGMFQFMPKTGENFGLTPQDLLDVAKSADAAARYITNSLESFKDDPMKEALAVLSYNRGVTKTLSAMKILVNDQNRQCSICALNADRTKLDEAFNHENVFYVPLFFAAAIIGENPQAFGLQTPPLSSN
ncbi:MAG TPA: transglycosylase SLT domain-containing protein [Pyrinomonadaceae bacterium]|nr:transglycosylase SLT domain-containing protein [Pyrinomonadaceae bacterium]